MQGRNLTRRSFIGLGAATAAGAILAGCSSSGAAGSSAAASASAEASSAASEAASEAASAASEAASAAASGTRPLVRLGTTNDGHIFNAIASAQGYLEEEGVDVEVSVFSSSDEAFAALFSNKVDVLSNQGTNLPLTHIAQGQDLTIYAGYMITGCMPIIAPAGTKWNGVEDLIGKTIACSGNEFAVFGPLYDAGHTMDEVTTIVLSNHADRVEAVATGKADYAICGTSQNYNISQKPEVEVMCYCSDITPNYSCCRVESTQEFIDANQDGLTAMLRAWLRAQNWYENNKEETAQLVVDQTGSNLDFVHAYMDNEHYRLNLDPYKRSVERAWDWMLEMGLFPDGADKIDVDDHINTDMYKAALDACTAKYASEDKEFYDKMNDIFEEYDA